MLKENLKHLRARDGLSQKALSGILGIGRTTLAGYEIGKTEPNIDTLIRIARHFRVSVDSLIADNLTKGTYEAAYSQSMKVLAVSTDEAARENIEFVPAAAAAGYAEQFNDPHFISDLPKISLPGFEQGTYRAFTVEGDSMHPVLSGSVVICEYLESLERIRDGRTGIVVTQDRGIIYKRLYNEPASSAIIASSDNKAYAPYLINYTDIHEIWAFRALVLFSDNLAGKQVELDQILMRFEELRQG